MILGAHGAEGQRRALGALDVSHRAQILSTADSATLRLLILLGLIDGSEIRVEARDFRGGVTIEANGRRMHIPAYFAHRIWVQPVCASGTVR